MPSIRQLMADDENIRVIKGEVRNIDIDGQSVTADLGGKEAVIDYDSLILAAGAAQSYFGNDHFAEFAPGMKSVDDALEIRARVTGAFERAEITSDPEERRRLLNFVVVGAGPTGVELAGQLAEMAHRTLAKEFRQVDTNDARIILIDGGPQVLPPFGKRLGRKARRKLEDLGVEVVLNSLVTDVDREGVTYKNMKTGEESSIPSYAKIWSAGVAASPLGKHVADQAGVESDRAGRVMVNEDLTLGEHKNVFLIGDMINLNGLPGVAQVAMQGGQYAAKTIIDEIENGTSPEARAPFDYSTRAHGDAPLQRCGEDQQGRGLRLHRLANVAGPAPAVPGRLPQPRDRRVQLGPELRLPPPLAAGCYPPAAARPQRAEQAAQAGGREGHPLPRGAR